jgi:hypothetical protein
MRWIMLGTVLLLAACDAKHDGAPIPPPSPIPGTYTYSYTLTSASLMPLGSRVILVTSPTDDYCSTFPGPFTHDFDTVVTIPNTVTFGGAILRSTYFWTSIYIDGPTADGFLSSGDSVWGTSPTSIIFYCTRPVGNDTVTVTSSWETLGTSITGGFTVYTGLTQSW